MVTPTGISMDTTMTDVVSVWPTLTTSRQSRHSWGFANFYCQLIVGFSDIVIPLICLTHKDTPIRLGPDHTKALNPQDSLHPAPILVHFNPDNPIVVETMLLTMQLPV